MVWFLVFAQCLNTHSFAFSQGIADHPSHDADKNNSQIHQALRHVGVAATSLVHSPRNKAVALLNSMNGQMRKDCTQQDKGTGDAQSAIAKPCPGLMSALVPATTASYWTIIQLLIDQLVACQLSQQSVIGKVLIADIYFLLGKMLHQSAHKIHEDCSTTVTPIGAIMKVLMTACWLQTYHADCLCTNDRETASAR